MQVVTSGNMHVESVPSITNDDNYCYYYKYKNKNVMRCRD